MDFTSVTITWGFPEEPNGIITVYRVSYVVNGQREIRRLTNVSQKFTTPQFRPSTNVSNITVAAHTIIGAGPAATHPYILIPRTPIPRES